MHVTVRLRRGLPSLRHRAQRRVLLEAFAAGCARAGGLGAGFRLVHFSIQGNHLHLIVEAVDRLHLSRGMQGLLIRTAKRLNRLWNRRGSVFADRYHDRVLKTPREVRHALSYVLHNARRHAAASGRRTATGLDVYSSGPWFDGWRQSHAFHNLPAHRPTAPPHTWLIKKGWRRHGLLGDDEVPGPL